MILQEEYNLNLESQLSKKYVKVSQYDTGRRLLITLLKNDCSMFKIPSEASASINGLKPDGKGFRYDCSIENNKVVVDMKEQMTVLAGYVKCEILLSKGGERIATANFMLSVEESPLSENTPISSTDIPLLQKAIEASEIVLSVEKTVKGYSESASKSSQSAQESAESASNASASSAASARNSSQSAQASAESANNASQSATNANASAENASNSAREAKTSADSAIQTKAEVEQLKKETVEQTKTLTESAKQEISTVKDATVLEVTQFKNDTISDITSIKEGIVEEVTVIKNDAKAEADKAKESETNAKLSETNASNSAKEAKASADSVANVVSDVSKLKEDIGNKATAIIKKALGKTIVINDSSNLPIKTLSGTGKIIITGKNILDIQKYGTTLLNPFEAKAGTLFTLITNGELSEGGNIKFIDENGEDVWFAIDKGKTKVSQKIASNVKGFYNLLVAKDGLKYCFSVGENDEYEEYVEQVITAPVDSEQLKAIHTNYPTTVLTSENEISVEYVADTEAYIGKKIQEALISQKILGV